MEEESKTDKEISSKSEDMFDKEFEDFKNLIIEKTKNQIKVIEEKDRKIEELEKELEKQKKNFKKQDIEFKTEIAKKNGMIQELRNKLSNIVNELK